MDVTLKGGLLVGGGGGGRTGSASAAAVAAAAAAVAEGEGGVTRYRARLLPHVNGGELVDLLARQDTVRRGRVGVEVGVGKGGRMSYPLPGAPLAARGWGEGGQSLGEARRSETGQGYNTVRRWRRSVAL